jgi:hypothetical protein
MKSILKDVDGKPVPQYWNRSTQSYEVIQGSDNKLNVNLVDAGGNPIHSANIIADIMSKLDEILREVKK